MTLPAATAVLDAIKEEDVVDLALALGNIDSPAGREGEVASFVFDWMDREGFAPTRVALLPERPNIVGRLVGRGGGQSLLFNSHMDTSVGADELWSTRHAADPIYHQAWRTGDLLFGNGVCNDKGQMAAWLVACNALREVGAPLEGDIILTAVCGEIETEAVDEYQAPTYASRELGTRYVISKGVVADCAVVAEATDFCLGYVEAGSVFVRVTAYGQEPPIYTPFVPEHGDGSPNAIVRLAGLVRHLEGWAAKYEQEHRYECPGGIVEPKVSIGAIRGGLPYKITKTAQQASLYLDIRLTPDARPAGVLRELRAALKGVGFETAMESFGYRRGWEATDIEVIAGAVRTAHTELFGTELTKPKPAITSMWRDINAFTEAGIPCVMYGPGPSIGDGNFAIRVADLVQAARAYALIGLLVTGTGHGGTP